MAAAAAKMRCMNTACGAPAPTAAGAAGEWRKGWPLRSGVGFAVLCDKCGLAYEQLIFCDIFHQKESGWRDCSFCGKHLHCGCVASKYSFDLLDSGGVQCVNCIKNAGPQSVPCQVSPKLFLSQSNQRLFGKSDELLPGRPLESPSLMLDSRNDDVAIISKSHHPFMVKNIEPGQSSNILRQKEIENGARQIKWEQQPTLSIGDIGRMPFLIRAQSALESPQSQSTRKDDNRDPAADSTTSESVSEACLSMSLGIASNGNKMEATSTMERPMLSPTTPFSEGRELATTLSPFQHAQRARHFLTRPPRVAEGAAFDPMKDGFPHLRVARPPAEGRGRNQLLPRYWPRITDQELQQISGDSNSTIVPLFEKVLSASDAGRIGRLVLPKACAEAYFPPISQPEGRPLTIQDAKGKEWHFQFRFWPNNNSRMYVLEGVTPCIQSLQLQAGDTVTFSRIEPGGKLVMGFRKATNTVNLPNNSSTSGENSCITDDSPASSIYNPSVEMQQSVYEAMMDNPLGAPSLSTSVNNLGSVFNEAGAGLRSGSKTILDSVQFGEPFPEYSTGFMEPALHSSVATRESSNVDHSSRLETFMSEALHTTNLVQNEAGALSAAVMPSSQNDSYADGSIRYPLSLDVFKIEPDGLKKSDSFSRWMSNNETVEVADLDIKSSSDAFWRTTENVNVVVNEQLDPYVVSPSLSQDRLFCIIDFSPSWAYTYSKTKILIAGRFLANKEDIQNCKWSCMFGDVEVLAEVIADGSLRCYTPVHQSGRVPFYVTCSNRVACSEVREFEFRDFEAQYMETVDPHTTGVNEMHLRIRLEKLLFLGPDDYEKYVMSDGNEKSELISTIGYLMLDDNFTNPASHSDEKVFSAAQDKNREKLVKDKLYYWLIHKIHDDGKGPNVLGKEGQGVIHLVAALGYDWAIRPIITAGVHVNFRDARGWTALHWAASCGRERTVGTLIANEAASGALTDPTPQFPSGRTPADLAAENGHKGIAGFLAESSLTSHLSALALKESKGDNLKLLYGSAEANEFAESSSTQFASQDSQAESLKDSLNAVRKSAQAAARIFQAFRVESFRRNKVIEYGDDDRGLSGEGTLPLVSLKNARPGQNDMLHSSAVRIQNKFRGWKGRKEFMIIRQRIIKLQAHVRGHQVRRSIRKIVWSVGILEKAILRWRRKGRGLRGFQPEKQLKTGLSQIQPARDEDEYDFLKDGRKQAEDRLQRALARVKSMTQYPEARAQYSRMLTCVTEQQESKRKMEDRDAETDILITPWIDAAMEGPVTASLGPMAPLLRQVHSLSAMGPEHIQGCSEDDVKRLQENLEVLCRDLLEPEETSSTPKWWRKEVRELLYDTEDRLDEVIIFQAGDFPELIADVEDACERRKRLQVAPSKTTKPDLGEAGLSCFTPQQMSVELSKPISIQGHPAGLGVVGIEDLMNKLVEQLAFDDDKQKRLKVIPIIGFPGVGKTTIAGILYYKYRGNFQCSAFVRVSRTPDTRSLLISILSQIKAPGLCGFPDVHDLIDGIREHLKGKRYFVIMDDLWTASIWDIISRAFPDGDYGCRIITTTQIDDVALACCRYYPDYIEISPLNDDQSKELFFTKVFGSEDHCPPDFKEVSCKIINKCAGLPLAIVSIASLLASESYLTVEKWEHIQDSLPCTRTNPTSEGVKGLSSDTAIGSGGRVLARGPKIEKWKSTQDSLPFTSEGLKQVLNLVYNNLPPHLKACLLYLCMYPEGYLVRRHDLVRQWVAEDFVGAMGGRSAEETAGIYFDELVSRGMVQPAATNHGNEVLSCTIHHMVLDLIRHKSKELNFIITVDNLQSTLALPDELRRLSVQFGGSKGADVPENILISKVRSLLYWGFFECVPSVVDYALLRVLILHIWADGDETSFDLTSISELLRLRYLKIQCNIMVNLPDEIKGLKCLETLEVDARLSAVPCDIGHLKKLLHLLLPSEAILPKGLDGLTSLLTLGCFDLSKNSTQNVTGLAELTSLQNVHLTCSTEPSGLPVGRMEHLGSILEKLNDLRSLTLHGTGSSSQIISDDGLSIVSPSPALLEKLELLPRICNLSRIPKWIGELSRLSILKIEVLDLSINDIAILKELASLASLSLSVRTEHAEWITFDNEGFPVLKYFKFVRTAPYTSFLEGAMPNVQRLKLAFDANRLKPEYSPETFGFQHMTSLKQISVKFGGAGADDSSKRDAERVWKDAFTNHPNNPIFDARWVDCIFNGDKTTDVEDTKGHDSRGSTSSDAIEVVGQIFKKARLD